MKPQQIAQKIKAGRGWLITRNSTTLADTDYEHVADEIVAALNAATTVPDYENVMELAKVAGLVIQESADPNSPPSWWGCGHNPQFEKFAALCRRWKAQP